MIELKITGCCNTCRYIDLTLDDFPVMFGIERSQCYRLRCVHESVCGALAKEKEALEREDL